MKKLIITSLILSAFTTLSAQKGKIGIGTPSPQTVLDVVSGRNGILIPRQTAAQIQSITPHEAELVYSLSDDGTTINKKGFWFYHSGVWRPLLENLTNTSNILYTVDGTVVSDRQLSQDGKFLNFGPDLLYLNGTGPTIGLLTTSPTQALDVNGDVRIQPLNSAANVISDTQGVLMHEDSFFEIGDVKPSYSIADHDGWYLLDGRALSNLPQIAQDNASNILGITTSLPDATGKYSMGTTAAPGTFTGSNTVTLTRANLPSFNFNYSTNSAGGHNHTVTYDRIRATAVNGGGNNIHAYWLSGTFVGGANYTRTTAGASHNHTYTVSSGGNSNPIDIRPNALNFNYFVYLGK